MRRAAVGGAVDDRQHLVVQLAKSAGILARTARLADAGRHDAVFEPGLSRNRVISGRSAWASSRGRSRGAPRVRNATASDARESIPATQQRCARGVNDAMDVSHLLDGLNRPSARPSPRKPGTCWCSPAPVRARPACHPPHRLAPTSPRRAGARHLRGDLHQQGRGRDAPSRRRLAAQRHARMWIGTFTASPTGCCACTGARRTCPKASRSSTATTSCGWSSAWCSRWNWTNPRFPPRARGGHQRAEGRSRRPQHIQPEGATSGRSAMLRAYAAYQQRCERRPGRLRQLLLRAHELCCATTRRMLALPAPLPRTADRRVPDTNAIQYGCAPARRRQGPRVRGRRRRPVDLRLARRRWRTCRKPCTTSRAHHPPRAELPLQRQHPRRRQRGDRATTRRAWARTCGPRPAPATASTRTPRSTRSTRRGSGRTHPPVGARRRAAEAAILHCKATRSRARSKRRLLAKLGANRVPMAACALRARRNQATRLAYLRLVAAAGRRCVRARSTRRARDRRTHPGRAPGAARAPHRTLWSAARPALRRRRVDLAQRAQTRSSVHRAAGRHGETAEPSLPSGDHALAGLRAHYQERIAGHCRGAHREPRRAEQRRRRASCAARRGPCGGDATNWSPSSPPRSRPAKAGPGRRGQRAADDAVQAKGLSSRWCSWSAWTEAFVPQKPFGRERAAGGGTPAGLRRHHPRAP